MSSAKCSFVSLSVLPGLGAASDKVHITFGVCEPANLAKPRSLAGVTIAHEIGPDYQGQGGIFWSGSEVGYFCFI